MAFPIGSRATRRGGLEIAAVPLLLLVGIWWLSAQAAAGQYRNVLIAMILAQTLWVILRWHASVYIFMVYVVMEGFLINYFDLLPELNVLKDVFVVALFMVLAAVLIPRGLFPLPRALWVAPFLAFSVVYISQVFNPNLPNLLVGLVGLRATLLYSLLFPVAYWFFDSRQRTIRFFLFLALLSVPISLFGIFQYFVGPAWMVSLSPGFARAVFYASGLRPSRGSSYFRTFSTFVQTGGFANYLAFMMLVCVALWMLPSLRRHRAWIGAVFVLQFLAELTTGGRAPAVMLVVAMALLLFMQRGSIRLAPFLVSLPLIMWGTLLFVGSGFIDRFASLLDVEYVRQRNMDLLHGWFTEAMATDWTGLGAGYATVAARHVGPTPLNIGVVENSLAKVRFEAGLPGLVLYIVFLAMVSVGCLRTPFRVRDPEMRWFAAVCAAFLLVHIFLNVPFGTPFDASPTNVYLWFFLGFLSRAPYLGLQTHSLLATSRKSAADMR